MPVPDAWPSCQPGAGAPRVVVRFDVPPERTDIPTLQRRVRTLVRRTGAGEVVCEVGALTEPDLAIVDALARLRLTAGRAGCPVRLRNACRELVDLLALAGLDDIVC